MINIRKMRAAVYSLALFPVTTYAQIGSGIDDAAPRNAQGDIQTPENATLWLNDLTSLLTFLAGAIAVIVIIFGGIRYITSTGDATRVKQAKDTILFGVIGLVIAILAYAIVKFIVANLG